MPRKKTTQKTSKKSQRVAVPVRTYRRIAATFIILTAFLFAFIVYLSFSKASITIETDYEPVSIDFSVNVEQEPSSRDAVSGKIVSIVVQGELDEETTGIEEEGEDVARGVVNILNKTSRDQVLIRTTRLITSDKKLFRLDEKVTAPANGEVRARIYADEPGEDYVIEPAFLTIPGLWEGLQDKIYAQSLGATSIGGNEIETVTQRDLDSASAKLRNDLFKKGKDELKLVVLENLGGQNFANEIVKEEFNVEVGDQADTVGISMELRVAGILYDKDALRNLAKSKLEESISSDAELVKIDYEKMRVNTTRYDLNAENANLRVFINGDTILKSNSQIFDKNHLVGMDKESAVQYFKNFSAVKSVAIELKPFWLKRIPELRDHIEIRIKR